MDQFKNDLSAAERLTDLVKPPSFDDAPTTARPITPDDWNDDPEDFEAHLEYFEPLKGRDRWTPAELGALLLPPLKLEMLLMQTANGLSCGDIARMNPNLGNPVNDAIAAGRLSASERDGSTTVDPTEGIAWLLSQGHRLPQEIAALADRTNETGEAAQASHQPVKTVVSDDEKYLLFTMHYPDGSIKHARFQKPRPNENPPMKYQIALVLLRFHKSGGVRLSREMLAEFGISTVEDWRKFCSTLRAINSQQFQGVSPSPLPLLSSTTAATNRKRLDPIRFNIKNLIIPPEFQACDNDVRVYQHGASLNNPSVDWSKDRALAVHDSDLERLIEEG